MIKIYNTPDSTEFTIKTDTFDENEFRIQIAALIVNICKTEKDESKNKLQTKSLLQGYAEIICKLRGYKADITEKRVLLAGPGGYNWSEEYTMYINSNLEISHDYKDLITKTNNSNKALQLSGGSLRQAGQAKPKASTISKAAKVPPTEL